MLKEFLDIVRKAEENVVHIKDATVFLAKFLVDEYCRGFARARKSKALLGSRQMN